MSGLAAALLPYPPDDPEVLRAAAARSARLAATVSRMVADLQRDALRLRDGWQGRAALAAAAELVALERLLGSLAEALQASSGVLRGHAEVLAEARARVDALRAQYDDLPATDGPAQALLSRRHQEVLDSVADDSARAAAHLGRAAAAVGTVGLGVRRPAGDAVAALAQLLPMLWRWRSKAGVGGPPPARGTSLRAVRTWWAALTSDERAAAVAAYPAQVGSLDGLPGAARSAANERRLTRDIALLQRAEGVLGPAGQRWLRTCRAVRAALAAVRATTDPGTGQPMTAQLLVYAPKAFGYEGRAALAVGDVDTAANVSFLVPGMGTQVATAVSDLTGRALRMATGARALTPQTTTATVAWLGYDAPTLGSVAFEDAAVAGSRLLAADLRAVQATRAVPAHLTVVAHSYGSTTAGIMLRDRRTGTDDVVLLGSPGAGVERAGELRVPAGHIFVGASSRDPVSYVDRFGADPATRSFGAVRFQAEDTTRNPYRLAVADHLKYLDAGSESLANVVRVVAGEDEQVVRAQYRWPLMTGVGSVTYDPEAYRDPATAP